MNFSNRAGHLASLLAGAASAGLMISFFVTPANAQALRDDWCKDTHIRFFVGGAEGDAFGTIVYNGAVQAAKDTGAQVDYVFSGWDQEKMIQQLREAVPLLLRAVGPLDAVGLRELGDLLHPLEQLLVAGRRVLEAGDARHDFVVLSQSG